MEFTFDIVDFAIVYQLVGGIASGRGGDLAEMHAPSKNSMLVANV